MFCLSQIIEYATISFAQKPLAVFLVSKALVADDFNSFVIIATIAVGNKKSEDTPLCVQFQICEHSLPV